MICKAHDFVDTNSLTLKYGIKVLYKGNWEMVGEGGSLYAFHTKEARDNKMKQLRNNVLAAT